MCQFFVFGAAGAIIGLGLALVSGLPPRFWFSIIAVGAGVGAIIGIIVAILTKAPGTGAPAANPDNPNNPPRRPGGGRGGRGGGGCGGKQPYQPPSIHGGRVPADGSGGHCPGVRTDQFDENGDFRTQQERKQEEWDRQHEEEIYKRGHPGWEIFPSVEPGPFRTPITNPSDPHWQPHPSYPDVGDPSSPIPVTIPSQDPANVPSRWE